MLAPSTAPVAWGGGAAGAQGGGELGEGKLRPRTGEGLASAGSLHLACPPVRPPVPALEINPCPPGGQPAGQCHAAAGHPEKLTKPAALPAVARQADTGGVTPALVWHRRLPGGREALPLPGAGLLGPHGFPMR